MRRTRHKLEPQCDQSCKQRTVQRTRTTVTTKKRHCKQTSSAVVHSTELTSLQLMFSWVSTSFRFCGHIKYVVVLVALHSCHHFTSCQCSHTLTFHLCVNSLQIFVVSHTAKNVSFEVLSLHGVEEHVVSLADWKSLGEPVLKPAQVLLRSATGDDM